MDKITDHYHHCASCRHFGFREAEGKKIPMCKRLGFDTQPAYQFDCWDPKDRVQAAIAKKIKEKD